MLTTEQYIVQFYIAPCKYIVLFIAAIDKDNRKIDHQTLRTVLLTT